MLVLEQWEQQHGCGPPGDAGGWLDLQSTDEERWKNAERETRGTLSVQGWARRRVEPSAVTDSECFVFSLGAAVTVNV